MKWDADKALGLAQVAIGLVGLYLAYKFFQTLKRGGESAGNAIGDAIAPLVVGSPVSVNAGVVLPSGERVSFNKIVATGSYLQYLGDENYAFSWGGVRYAAIPPRRADGWLNARRLQ
jgi:hypothetical protein